MGRIGERADRMVKKIFVRSSGEQPVRSEKVVSLQERLRKRREQALRTRRGL